MIPSFFITGLTADVSNKLINPASCIRFPREFTLHVPQVDSLLPLINVENSFYSTADVLIVALVMLFF